MKNTLSVQLRYSESVIRVIQPFLPLYHSKAILFVVSLVIGDMFLLYPLWKIGFAGYVVWMGVLFLAIIILLRTFAVYRGSGAVLTSERLIDVDRPGMFMQAVHECALGHIQEVRYYKRGLFAMLTNTGTVVIQPSNDQGRIELPCVKNPEQLKELILRTCKTHTEKHQSEEEL